MNINNNLVLGIKEVELALKNKDTRLACVLLDSRVWSHAHTKQERTLAHDLANTIQRAILNEYTVA